jgi:uncharacterized membrane protein YhaH (DUF805 family)
MSTEVPEQSELSRLSRSTSLYRLFELWLGLTTPVGRLSYILTGFGLGIFKYLTEATTIYVLTERFYTPIDFINPLINMRERFFEPPAPEWLSWVVLTWSLVYLWIGLSMSVRRAIDAGYSAWIGLVILVTGINFLMMAMLCWSPSIFAKTIDKSLGQATIDHELKSALWGVSSGLPIGIGMLLVSVYGFGSYGAALFIATPVVAGAISSYLYNQPCQRSLWRSLAIAHTTILICGLATLLLAFEGIICLLMLYPLATILAGIGGWIGYCIALPQLDKPHNTWVAVALLVLVTGTDQLPRSVPLFEVRSSIDIDASPSIVWRHVVGFSEVELPPEWFFQLGIAYPKRARIQGRGPGAIRYCEFSTGPFVEPITVWDEPHRLAFDVVSQPPPMHELSPYRHVHPPHLDGYFRSKRGEFRLISLEAGGTRLEGSTWYELDLFPQEYWTLWTDGCIHQIHRRVLRHVKELAEADARTE